MTLVAAGGHGAPAARQRAIVSTSFAISAATPRHLVHSTPSGARNANIPNGSAPDLRGGGPGASVAVSSRAATRTRSEGDPSRWPSTFARTLLMVKKRAGAAAGGATASDS